METALSGFALAFDPLSIFVVVIGVISGIMIGALPGLTATMGVTLLLPFTLTLELPPQASIAMLIGIYVGAIYGGSIAAILIATPGTPAAAATVLDGFPLTQRGEAGRALVLATSASVCGGMISALTLTFLSPYLSRLAIKFDDYEYFALAVFGLSMIVTVSGKDVIKGIISGVFGLLIATVGVDPTAGVPRFWFGHVALLDGLGFIPILIGLFAFSQVFVEVSEVVKKTFTIPKVVFSFPSLRETLGNWFVYIRSGFIGTFIGSLPGAGCDIAAFVSYNEAKRVAKKTDRFGDGEPKGIIAAEGANNGATGGAMIPMLTLGVPGDAVTAVMLSALTIQGLQPGPALFREHPETVYPIFACMIIANITLAISGLISARFLSKLITLDKRIMLPIICVLSVVGAYAIKSSLFDVAVAIVMGGVGFGMRRWGFPASPIVLALILGPMAESSLGRVMLKPDFAFINFFYRKISFVLLLLALLTVGTGITKRLLEKRKEFSQNDEDQSAFSSE